MRTVTFSNPKVARIINSDFVPVWINRVPGFHNCEFRTEKRIFGNSQEAYATRNICTFFMTPDETVLHYVSGYYSPNVFLNALYFARGLKKNVGRPDRIRKVHAEFAKHSRKEVNKMKMQPWKKALARYGAFTYDRKHVHSAFCTKYIVEAMEHWASVHSRFSRMSSFPSFTSVRSNYLFGNRFSEERSRSTTDPSQRRRDSGSP